MDSVYYCIGFVVFWWLTIVVSFGLIYKFKEWLKTKPLWCYLPRSIWLRVKLLNQFKKREGQWYKDMQELSDEQVVRLGDRKDWAGRIAMKIELKRRGIES